MAELSVTLYSSSFCGACTSTRQTLDQIAPLLGSRVEWREVNVADAPDESEARGIVATPTIVITTPDGTERMRASGVPSPDQVLTALAAALP
ncbi:glutaredoxin family protein [Herbiconiux ginsengi]|uniref:Glutaredoxin n=1 Tax=Herbiconiux ginsengi TaxID=381665 RepID=A0A1H3MSW4_9MICO|nr:thioredoxin domain-containing protein [Herbiconiux ginsengi]SDY79275.1 Glutaredoxin [Herbiconiux ginsengi]